MMGFEKESSPSKSNAVRNLSFSGWVENDENDENDSSIDKLIPQFEHKVTFGEHPTSVAQRKKILEESNEFPSVSDGQNHKNCNLNEENASVGYDPLKNYLSPRPQFLRYNPSRRHKILERIEKENIYECDSSLDSDGVKDGEESSAEENDGSAGGVVNQINGGMSEEVNDNIVGVGEEEEEDEEEEEEEVEKEVEEEERGWCLKGVLKLLLTLIACLLSTSYICSMKSRTNAPIQQAVWNLKDSGIVFKNGTLEFVSTRLDDDGFFEVGVGANHRGVEEVQIYKESHGEIDESFEAEIVEYLEWHEKEMVRYENEDGEDMVDEAAEYEGVGAVQFDFEVDKLQQLIDENAAENLDDGSMSLDHEGESSRKDEAAETEIIGNGEVDSEPQSSEQLIGAEPVESEDASEFELEIGIDSSINLQGPELTMKSISEDIPMESKGEDDTRSLYELVGSHGELSDSLDDEDDEIEDDDEVGMETSELKLKLKLNSTIVGVFAVFILTSLAIIYHSQKSRRSTQRRVEFLPRASAESEHIQKQKFAVENINTVLPVPSIERRVEFLPKGSLSSHSMREAPRELANHIHAPTVELIGEIDVGPSSIRRSGKYQMTISDSDYFDTLSQPTTSTSSTSYGSFTTERKISTKERGQSREATTVTTPVRRSSRLRSRSAVMSP